MSRQMHGANLTVAVLRLCPEQVSPGQVR